MQDDLRITLSSSLSGEAGALLRALDEGAYTAFNAQMRENFLRDSTQVRAAMRDQLKAFLKRESPASMRSHLGDLCKLAQLLRDNARIAGFARIASVARTLVMFLRVLEDRPETVNPSTIRTVTHTIDFLDQLFAASAHTAPVSSTSPLVLVIDDECSLVSLVCEVLEQADFRVLGVDDPSVALQVLGLNRFDLVFLDIKMPGMDGFELCSKLRLLPRHKETPVVFLTGLSDFEHRAHSILAGGNDLIAKPFLPAELIVKALAYIYQSQLAPGLRK